MQGNSFKGNPTRVLEGPLSDGKLERLFEYTISNGITDKMIQYARKEIIYTYNRSSSGQLLKVTEQGEHPSVTSFTYEGNRRTGFTIQEPGIETRATCKYIGNEIFEESLRKLSHRGMSVFELSRMKAVLDDSGRIIQTEYYSSKPSMTEPGLLNTPWTAPSSISKYKYSPSGYISKMNEFDNESGELIPSYFITFNYNTIGSMIGRHEEIYYDGVLEEITHETYILDEYDNWIRREIRETDTKGKLTLSLDVGRNITYASR